MRNFRLFLALNVVFFIFFLISNVWSVEPIVSVSGNEIDRLVREFAEKIEAAGYNIDEFERMIIFDTHNSHDEAILRFYLEERLKQIAQPTLPQNKDSPATTALIPRKTTGATSQRGLSVIADIMPSATSVNISLVDGSGRFKSTVSVCKDSDLIALLGEELSDIPALTRLSSSDGSPPFSVSIRSTNGSLYPILQHDGYHSVSIPIGSTYSIILENGSYETMSASVFIDGLNTIYQVRELPSTGLKWVIDPMTRIAITGWQISDVSSRTFKLTEAGDSVAATKGMDYAVGVITVVFFESEYVPSNKSESSRSLSGTGIGGSSANSIQEVATSGTKRAIQVLQLRYSE